MSSFYLNLSANVDYERLSSLKSLCYCWTTIFISILNNPNFYHLALPFKEFLGLLSYFLKRDLIQLLFISDKFKQNPMQQLSFQYWAAILFLLLFWNSVNIVLWFCLLKCYSKLLLLFTIVILDGYFQLLIFFKQFWPC